jgi:hypothetical protein
VNRYVVISAAFAVASAVGCAGVEQQQSAEPRAEKTYNTGSRIPVRDGSGSGSVRSVEATKETTDDIAAKSRVVVPGRGGGAN